jgi:7-cyano-7-deazaguanine reductase
LIVERRIVLFELKDRDRGASRLLSGGAASGGGHCGAGRRRTHALPAAEASATFPRPVLPGIAARKEPAVVSTKPSKSLETFPNPQPGRDYTIRMRIPEFTCLCPKTGQPDFATIHIDYVPDKTCVELKSLKLYMWSFRNEGAFHEAVTNLILDDLVRATKPRFMRLTAEWYVRGGIYTTVVAEHRKKGWKSAPAVTLP